MKVILNSQFSRFFHNNGCAAQSSIFEPTLYLIVTNNLTDVVSSKLGISAERTSIYSGLKNISDRQLICKITNLLLTLTRNILQTLTPPKGNCCLLFISGNYFCLLIADANVQEMSSLPGLGHKMKWDDYIVRSPARNVGLLRRVRTSFSAEFNLNIYNRFSVRVEYCSHI